MYYCNIDKKKVNISELKKNPHTISFFCDISNVKKKPPKPTQNKIIYKYNPLSNIFEKTQKI